MILFSLYFLIIHFFTFTSAYLSFQPEQVHISMGSKYAFNRFMCFETCDQKLNSNLDGTREILITWSTRNHTKESIVEYGIQGMIKTAFGYSTEFLDDGSEKHKQYIHRVLLKDLTPSSKYLYHCGSALGWSPQFWFKTPPDSFDWSPRLAIFGDMGNENAQSLSRLQEETQKEMFDAILHVGDFAYDMNTENGRVGDEFMRQIESIAAYVPYMVCAGNHEEKYNFSHYRARFSMPGDTESLVYSFDMGPVHFIGFSTEVYYFLKYGIKQLVRQYQWIENDLLQANKLENRIKRPWIVTFGHRPMYCSDTDGDDCTQHETLVRVGLPFFKWFGLEDLFYKHGVDLNIWAHEHSYERLFPIYNYKVYNGSYEKPYVNPKAPVHIVTGSAGCKEGRDNFNKTLPPWSAFRSQDYGYTRFKAYNATHLHLEQISVDKMGQIIDEIWIVKENHGHYSLNVEL